MHAPTITPDEPERLAALRALRLLDTPIEERFERLTRLAKRSFGVAISAISLIDKDRQWFKSIQGLPVCETSRDVSFCGHAIHSDDVMVVNNATEDVRFHDNPLVTGDPNIRFYAGCPLHTADGRRVGTLCLIDSQPRGEFRHEDQLMLRDIARMVEDEMNLKTVARAQGSLIEELDRARLAAAVDPLTRIWNRGAILDILRRELSGRAMPGHGTGVVMIDFDHFKKINDVHGHPAGDAVLREGVTRMLSMVRAIDAIGRYGGEEFIAVLTACTETELGQIAERLRASIDGYPMVASGALLGVSASFGTAWHASGNPIEPEALIAIADAALYRAKGAGRNRIERGQS